MPKKNKDASFSRAEKRVNADVRAEDERLREELRNADMRKLDKALAKAIQPGRPQPHR
ncbi:MAG: hypothetical protein HY271_11720 [Deltaproteobacteria bacterium]|nr:hypothetical protein [Deltaproteobacteria bacterium]